jgi:penicillin amidase
MSAPTPTPVVVRRPLRVVLGTLAALILMVGVAALAIVLWFYFTARFSLPQVDGSVRVPGLSQRVTVVRDHLGVPHIQAGNLADLFFAQGYVTAQDRLWQMDFSRRTAAGDLAEVLGGSALEHDRRQRLLLMRATAERITASLPESNRAYLEAYTRGVNAFLESHRDRLPIEFRVLCYQPRPWQAVDAILIGLNMSQLMNVGDESREVDREKILAKLPPELATDLYPSTSWRDHPPGSERPKMQQLEPEDEDDHETPEEWQRSRAALFPFSGRSLEADPARVGSNNWVVSGSHTVSGKPLLSNDPHLPLQIPNIWYEAHLEVASATPPFDVAGYTLPGIPFVILGHNRRIAWGMTNVGPDVTDLYIENFNAQGEYQTPEGWKKPEIRHEVIHVKGRPDVSMEIEVTRHGPIVSQEIPGETRKLALKWVVYDPAASLVPFVEIDTAQNWEEFQRALAHFDSPSQNLVYADVDGHIGWHVTGKIPIRPPGPREVPSPGSDNSHEWTGYIPFDKLPSVYDPPSGIIATANNRIVGKRYPYFLTDDWEAPYRAERIYRVLESGKQFAAADMLQLQMDVQSEFDRFCAEQLAYAVDHAKSPSPRARAAADILRSWDGRMTPDAAAPAVVVQARQHLWQRLLEPKLGSDHALYHWGLKAVALENILTRQPERWLPSGYSGYNELLTAAVEDAVKDRPADVASWRWGEQSPLELTHPVFGRIPLLRRWAGPGGKEHAGSAYTVNALQRRHGPSERTTVDLADLDNSTMNLMAGQSGQLFSPHYMDQFSAWYEGKSFAFPFAEQAVKAEKQHELILEP